VGLRIRLIVLILLAAVPVFVVQVVHDYAAREDRSGALVETAETLAGLVAARQDRIVEGARLLLTVASHLSSIRERNSEECNRRLREIARQVPEVTAIAVMNPAGERWCISIVGAGPMNLADREYFQATIRSETLQTSDFIVGRQTGEGSVVFTYPVRGPTGVEAIVFVAYRTSVLSSMLNDPPLPPGALVALLDRNGVVTARWPDPDKWIGKNLSSSDVVRRAIGERRGSMRAFADWAGSDEYAFAFSPVRAPTNLTVLVGLPLTPTLRDAEARFWRAIGWTSFIFLLAILIALVGAHLWVVAPLRQLHGSVEALARGDLSSTSFAPLSGSKELRSVGEALSATALVLRERETALRQSEEAKAAVIHTALDSIVVIDEHGKIVDFNPAAEQTFGIPRAEAIGRSLADTMVPPEQRKAHTAGLARYLATGEARVLGKRLEMEAVRSDGSRFPVDLAIVESWVHGKRFFTGHLRDISDRKRAEQLLLDVNLGLEERVEERTRELTLANEKLQAEIHSREEAEGKIRHMQKIEAVGQLTGGIAHDFNNMLAIIIGSLRMLQRRLERGETDVQRFVDGAIDGADRAAALTKRLLAFSRQQPLSPQVVDGSKLIAGMSDFLRRTIPENIEIESVLAGGLWRMNADPHQLENSILNLALNARDAMPNGGKLTIETANTWLDEAYAAAHADTASGQYVMIAVTDNGTGMAPAVVERAFDPFFTTKAAGRGTGLGLSQVHGFIKQSGGHIKIYSEPGLGTTVKIYLPRHAGEGMHVVSDRAPTAVPSAKSHEKILLVEDDERVRTLTSEILQELGYQVVEAEGAATALKLLEQHPDVAMLFTDIVMAGLNGRQLAEEAIKRLPRLNVLFATGYTRNAIVHNGILDAGVNVIMKPYTMEALAIKIRAVLDGLLR
jgi:PAS domain S-box-containing protein